MRRATLARGGLSGFLAVSLLLAAAPAPAFDFDRGNAPLLVVTPRLVPAIYQISPTGGDAPIVIRIVTVVDNAAFDAIAPYHPTAVGIYSRIPRRPAAESATNRNKNIAILYAVYRALNSLLPQNADEWRKMMTSVGLDPDNDSRDLATPIGIGNVAGYAVVAARERDGMNQLGDEGGRKYNRQPYADYTGYQPVNTPHQIVDPSRWQPNITTRNDGLFRSQVFVTPQWALTEPYSFDDPTQFRTPVPDKSYPATNPTGYKEQVDEVLALTANLTDRQKMIGELFDDKIRSLGGIAVYTSIVRRLSLDEFVQLDFLGHMATFDAGIVCWQEKVRFDVVRPFTAIKYLYGDDPVTAYGGPFKGKVSDLPASQFRSYTPTGDHPDYPSGSACFCAAFGQAYRRYLGTDAPDFLMPVKRGSSRHEPGLTPRRHLVLGGWGSWSEFEEECAMSRVHSGVHFKQSVVEGRELCRPVGDLAYEFLKSHIDGTAPPPAH